MGSFDLNGSWAKQDRAETHVSVLRTEFPADVDLIRLGREYDDNAREVVYYIKEIADLDPRWALVVGDAIQNMRAALDHLMWQVGRRSLGRVPTHKESVGIQFPLVRRKKDLLVGRRYLKYVNPSDILILQRFQPYKRLPKGHLHPLPALTRLSNIDKHRRLHLVVVRAASGSFTNRVDAYRDCDPDPRIVFAGQPPGHWAHDAPDRRMRENDVIMRCFVHPTGPHPDVELDASLTGQIQIGKLGPVLPLLDGLGTYVANVLRSFEPTPWPQLTTVAPHWGTRPSG